jgi:hypothetical protein
MKTSFWTYFTSGYGTIWLILLGCSLVTQEHLDAGLFGLIGFPVIAALYAGIRRSNDSARMNSSGGIVIPPRMAQFLTVHPEFLNSPQQLRDAAFYKWSANNK